MEGTTQPPAPLWRPAPVKSMWANLKYAPTGVFARLFDPHIGDASPSDPELIRRLPFQPGIEKGAGIKDDVLVCNPPGIGPFEMVRVAKFNELC